MLNHNYLLYIAAFFCAFSISLIATPWSKKLAIKLGAVDYPKDRGMHKEPMPRLGGSAIVFGFLTSLFILYPFYRNSIETKQFIGFLIGAIIIVALGLLDDTRQLKAKTKLIVQVIAALIVIASGIRINVVMFPFTVFLQTLSVPITLIWIIGVTNAVNLIDGLDGLAAGVSSISALVLMVLCALTGSQLAVFLTATLAGSCLGFLPRNINPAETFMGDTGSTFLGFVLAVTSILGVFKGYAVIAVAISILPIALPVFDTFFAMARRALRGQSIMQADRGHLHHKLIDIGFSHKQTVAILYIISLLSGIIAIFIAIEDKSATLFTASLLAILGIILFFYARTKKSHEEQ